MKFHTVLLDFPGEFVGIEQDRSTVGFRQFFMVRSEFTESLRCAYELLDWKAEWEIHISRLLMRVGFAYSDNPMPEVISSE